MLKDFRRATRFAVASGASAAILLSVTVLGPATAAMGFEQKSEHGPEVVASTKAAPEVDPLDLASFFQGDWNMQGRFRYSPEADWLPTKSNLTAKAKLGAHVILRDIEAPQISFTALDLITYDPRTGVVQYVYLNNNSPTAIVFEGNCKDGCRLLELEQICGAETGKAGCSGRTTMTVESPDRFVARDYIPGPEGKRFMSREVVYTRADATDP